jgi:hypothetical protein
VSWSGPRNSNTATKTSLLAAALAAYSAVSFEITDFKKVLRQMEQINNNIKRETFLTDTKEIDGEINEARSGVCSLP